MVVHLFREGREDCALVPARPPPAARCPLRRGDGPPGEGQRERGLSARVRARRQVDQLMRGLAAKHPHCKFTRIFFSNAVRSSLRASSLRPPERAATLAFSAAVLGADARTETDPQLP